MTAKRALETMSPRRKIYPNDGFMKSLIELDTKLYHPHLVKEKAEIKSEDQPSTAEEACEKKDVSNGTTQDNSALKNGNTIPCVTVEEVLSEPDTAQTPEKESD